MFDFHNSINNWKLSECWIMNFSFNWKMKNSLYEMELFAEMLTFEEEDNHNYQGNMGFFFHERKKKRMKVEESEN